MGFHGKRWVLILGGKGGGGLDISWNLRWVYESHIPFAQCCSAHAITAHNWHESRFPNQAAPAGPSLQLQLAITLIFPGLSGAASALPCIPAPHCITPTAQGSWGNLTSVEPSAFLADLACASHNLTSNQLTIAVASCAFVPGTNVHRGEH